MRCIRDNINILGIMQVIEKIIDKKAKTSF